MKLISFYIKHSFRCTEYKAIVPCLLQFDFCIVGKWEHQFQRRQKFYEGWQLTFFLVSTFDLSFCLIFSGELVKIHTPVTFQVAGGERARVNDTLFLPTPQFREAKKSGSPLSSFLVSHLPIHYPKFHCSDMNVQIMSLEHLPFLYILSVDMKS
jgi:hypothetical protein